MQTQQWLDLVHEALKEIRPTFPGIRINDPVRNLKQPTVYEILVDLMLPEGGGVTACTMIFIGEPPEVLLGRIQLAVQDCFEFSTQQAETVPTQSSPLHKNPA